MRYVIPDGKHRSNAEERRLNEIFKLVLTGTPGLELLAYLKSITINSVAGPGVHPNHLMHLEGQRYVVGLIEQRLRHGMANQPPKEPDYGPTHRGSKGTGE